MRKRLVCAGALGACGVAVLAGRRLVRERGLLRGLAYRALGRHPDPDVPDDVLADRVRSTLGSVCHRLDVPRVHVMVNRRMATIHGSVDTAAQATEIEKTVARVPGIECMTSHLRIGLGTGEHRPSDAGGQSSRAFRRLVGAAGDEHHARAVLAIFTERIPASEREQLLGHLPRDARSLAVRAHHRGAHPVRTLDQLDEAVSAETGLDRHESERIAAAVLGALKELVPEEAADVAAVLPQELRAFWVRAPAA